MDDPDQSPEAVRAVAIAQGVLMARYDLDATHASHVFWDACRIFGGVPVEVAEAIIAQARLEH